MTIIYALVLEWKHYLNKYYSSHFADTELSWNTQVSEVYKQNQAQPTRQSKESFLITHTAHVINQHILQNKQGHYDSGFRQINDRATLHLL